MTADRLDISDALPSPSPVERSAVRTQVRGSTLLLLGRCCSLGLNLITQVIIVRALSKSGYGTLAYVVSLVEIFSMGALFALDKTTLRYGAIYHAQKDRPRLMGALALAGLIPLVSGLALITLLYFGRAEFQPRFALDNSSWFLLLILAWLIPTNGLACVAQSAANVVYGAKSLFWRKHLLSPLIKVVAVSVAATLGSTPEIMATALAIAGGCGLLADIWLMGCLVRDEQLGDVLAPSRWKLPWRDFLGDCLPVLATDLAYLFRGALLVIFLGWWSTPEATASMRAVLPVAKLNELVLLNFMAIFVPLASRLHANRETDALWTNHRLTNLWILTLSFPIFAGIAALAEPATVLLFGSAYADSAPVLILLAFAYFLQAIYGMDGHLLRVLGQMRVLLVVDLCGSVALGLAACALIPRGGAAGAGAAAIIGIGLHGELRRWALTATVRKSSSSVERRSQAFVLATAVLVSVIAWLASPGWVLGGLLAAVASAGVMLAMRHQLDVDGTLPELRKLPGSNWWMPQHNEATSPRHRPQNPLIQSTSGHAV